MATYSILGVFLFGIAIGAAVAWLLSRGRQRPEIDAAVAQARADANAQLAAATTRGEQVESARQQLRAERGKAKLLEKQLVDGLATAKGQIGQLTEKASRVQGL